MRIYKKEERLEHSLATINYFFANEYNYYSENNVRLFEWEGKRYGALYRRLNVQLMVTKKCPFDCPFCIEKINAVGKEDRNETLQKENLKKLLEQLIVQEIAPTVSITGGEPTIFCDYVMDIKNMLDEMGVVCNINTAGVLNSQTKDLFQKFERVNLSVHSHDKEENNRIFGLLRRDYWNDSSLEHATIQSVVQDADMGRLKDFLDSFKQKRFSVRFPSETATVDSIEWRDLFRSIETDDDFKFIQQKIGDYYWYEEYMYKNEKLVRFSFSSMRQLEYYKNKFQYQESHLTRACIVLPDGQIRFDWIAD